MAAARGTSCLPAAARQHVRSARARPSAQAHAGPPRCSRSSTCLRPDCDAHDTVPVGHDRGRQDSAQAPASKIGRTPDPLLACRWVQRRGGGVSCALCGGAAPAPPSMRPPLLSRLLSGRQDPTYTSPHATRIAHTLAKRLFVHVHVHVLRTTLHVRRAFARRERSAFEKNLYTRLRSVHVLWHTIYG